MKQRVREKLRSLTNHSNHDNQMNHSSDNSAMTCKQTYKQGKSKMYVIARSVERRFDVV